MRDISIHALLAESDTAQKNLKCPCLPISIHALLAESDGAGLLSCSARIIFLSTLSLRRATVNDAINGCNPDIISIHALLAESDAVHFVGLSALAPISIHALLAESDLLTHIIGFSAGVFLSTLSLRRATRNRIKAR